MSSVTKNTTDQSVDYDFFSRIHDAPLGEKGNKDREEFDDQQKITLQEEEQRKEDLKDFAVDGFQQAVNEQRQEFMQSIHGFDFTEDDFKEAVRKNLENWDEFSADMKPEDAEEFKTLSIMALSATGDDLERIQNRMNEISPDKLQQTEQSADSIHDNRENKADPTQTASISESERQAQIISSMETQNSEGSFEALTKAPSTGTTDVFNSFADTSDITPTPIADTSKPTGTDNIFERFV